MAKKPEIRGETHTQGQERPIIVCWRRVIDSQFFFKNPVVTTIDKDLGFPYTRVLEVEHLYGRTLFGKRHCTLRAGLSSRRYVTEGC